MFHRPLILLADYTPHPFPLLTLDAPTAHDGNLKLVCNLWRNSGHKFRFGNYQFAPSLVLEIRSKEMSRSNGLLTKSTCLCRDLQENELLTVVRGFDLYTISLRNTSSTPICFMAKASPTQASLVPQGLKASNYDNSDPVPPRQNVVPSAKKPDSSHQGLEFLFNPLLEEYYNPHTKKTQECKKKKRKTSADENNIDQAPQCIDELYQFDRLKVWELVEKPFGKMVIKLKWLWKNKKDEDQTVIHNKARLVAKGYAQEEGIDFEESFAPVCSFGSCSDSGFELTAISTLEQRRKSLDTRKSTIWREIQFLGELTFYKALPEDRFKYLVRRIGMRCLTPAELENIRVILLVFTMKMEILLEPASNKLLVDLEESWHEKHSAKYLVDPSVSVDPMFEPRNYPVDPGAATDPDEISSGPAVPKKWTGPAKCGRFFTLTSYIDQGRVLRYLRGSTDLGLQLLRSTISQLIVYFDADWQDTLSRSSAQAEYRGVANAVAETSWIRNLLRELHTPLFTATLVYCDNVSAVYMSVNPIQHQRTKHIEIDIHFVHDKVAAGHVRVLHVPSRFQYADIFTKGLPYPLFADFRSSLSVRKTPAPTAGAY
ncbi:ribonuclease H-like domain-containing protein [Tanacetum coccineum]|uniref:Ribonuclease H-like domain-containing protein n=1 Tax=Tanacetum coccineum TaxID=301880 RepID=A0ABQ5JB35_9ASTR